MNGLKQWPLGQPLNPTDGKQSAHGSPFYFNVGDVYVERPIHRQASLPVFRHEVRETGELMTETKAPILVVVSINRLTGEEKVWA